MEGEFKSDKKIGKLEATSISLKNSNSVNRLRINIKLNIIETTYNKDFKNPLEYERKLHEKSGIEIFNESVYDMFYTNEKLKECCKMNKIKNYSKMNKLELRKSLMNI